MSKPNPRKGIPNKLSLTAINDLERLGLNPIEMLKAVYDEAMAAYRSGRGYGDKSDAGPYYLGVAGKAATDLAKFKYPTMSAIAVADLTKDDGAKKPLTTQEAIKVLQADPFAPQSVKEIDTTRVIEAMNANLESPLLPEGSGNE